MSGCASAIGSRPCASTRHCPSEPCAASSIEVGSVDCSCRCARNASSTGIAAAINPMSAGADTGTRTPLDVAEGDEVLYSKYGGTEIKVDGEELLVLRESDVLAKVQ